MGNEFLIVNWGVYWENLTLLKKAEFSPASGCDVSKTQSVR